MRRTQRYSFVILLLVIEFVDEFVFGAEGAAWPLIRTDLGLSYTHIGILFSVPMLVSSLVEPFLGVLADTPRRRAIILGGGVLFGVALLLTSVSLTFPVLLLAFILVYPASGAFVNISQAALMDADPSRHEVNMARWTFAGSLGVVSGPLALSVAIIIGAGWRGLYLGFACITALLLVFAWRLKFPIPENRTGENSLIRDVIDGIIGIRKAITRKEVLRWLVLLEFANLMLDVLLGFLALYFVDEIGLLPEQAALAVLVWSGVGLIGDFLLIPLLKKIPGILYLRYSVLAELLIFPLFMLVEIMWLKIMLLGFLGLFNSGWYAITKAGLYSAMPGQSGTSQAVNNLSGIIGSFIPLCLGIIAERYNLTVAMWCLLAGPIVLWIGLPRMNLSLTIERD